MIDTFAADIIDSFNVIFVWRCINKKDTSYIKFILAVISIGFLSFISDYFKLSAISPYIFIAIVLRMLYKEKIIDIVFEISAVLLINMVLQLLIILITSEIIMVHNLNAMVGEIIECITIIFLYKLGFLNNNIKYKYINNEISKSSIFIFIIYFIVLKMIWNYNRDLILDNICAFILVISTLSICQVLIYIKFYREIKEKEKLKISSEYSNVINEISEEIRRRQHEFVNYKNTILGIVNVLDNDEIKPAILKYMNEKNYSDDNINKLMYIDNIVIRSIIYKNIGKADGHNVNFQYNIENNVIDNILSYHEISNVLGNLLNNSFDEVIEKDCINKNVEIDIKSIDSYAYLSIKNNMRPNIIVDINSIFEKGFSTKTKDSNVRGYGLYNVQQIINKHKGKIQIKAENEEFKIIIILKCK